MASWAEQKFDEKSRFSIYLCRNPKPHFMFDHQPILLDDPGCRYPYLLTNTTVDTINGTEIVPECTLTQGDYVHVNLIPVQAVVRTVDEIDTRF